MTDSIRILRKTNLNLLPVLAALLRCRNVTHAAKVLNLSQSTVSGDLRKLREILDDELLVQCGRELQLTEKAKRLAPDVMRLATQIGNLFETEPFEPFSAEVTFQIATADYVSALFVTRIGKTLQTHAPQISLMLSPTPGASSKALLLGTLDLIICPNRRANLDACGIGEDCDDFGREVIMRDELVSIQWSGHSSAGSDVDIVEYFERPHAIYCRTDNKNTIEQDAIESIGAKQNNQFLIPYFTLLPHLVVESNLIAVIPRTLADQYSKFLPIHTFQPPYMLPALELTMLWSRARESYSDLRWLRSVVREAASAETSCVTSAIPDEEAQAVNDTSVLGNLDCRIL